MNPIGYRIRELRQAKDLGLSVLAERSGLSKGYLSELETSEEANPTLDVLMRIAKALDLTIADLVEAPRARPSSPAGNLPDGLRQFVRDRQKAGKPLEQETVLWLAGARFRGKKPVTKEDFAYLYRSLRESTEHDDDGED